MNWNPYKSPPEQPTIAGKVSRNIAVYAVGATAGVTIYWLFNSGSSMTLRTYQNAPLLMLMLHAGVFMIAMLIGFVPIPRANARLRPWVRFALRFAGGAAFVITGLMIQSFVRPYVDQILTPGPIALTINLSFGIVGGLLLSALLERNAGTLFVATGKIDEPDDAHKSPS